MPSRPELYADKINYRAYQIDASMRGEQPMPKAQWLAQQGAGAGAGAGMGTKKKKS